MIDKPFSLEGKTLLITGASSGIGRAVAQACAHAGASCVITARNLERLQETFGSLDGEGHSLLIADLSKLDEVNRLVTELPKLDGVVMCAGVVETVVFKFTEDSDTNNLFGVNTFSIIRLLRSIIQEKRLNKEASIIMISSISGVKCGIIGGTLYGASKGALEGFAKALALELAPQKIRVNTICPGMIETKMVDNCDVNSEQIEADKMKYPMKRYGKPEEIGYAAVYLLSDVTRWMTGTSLLIDGGYTLN